jgi:hypothetical protein
MDLSKLLDAIKLSPRYLVPVFFASGFLLFSPTTYIASLGLDSFVTSYRSWIGLVFLVSSALLLSHFFISVWTWVKRKLDAKKSSNEAINHLRNLTPDEKALLQGYIFNQTKTQNLDMMNGVVNGLVHVGIIYQASRMGDLLEGFAYNIQPWAWEFLNKNKRLLEISEKEKDFVHGYSGRRSRRAR